LTYNFDPDRWYETHRKALDARRAAGAIAEDEYQAQLDQLERRYDEMVARLDKPFELSDTRHSQPPPRRE
jgi:hypothetical protein